MEGKKTGSKNTKEQSFQNKAGNKQITKLHSTPKSYFYLMVIYQI